MATQEQTPGVYGYHYDAKALYPGQETELQEVVSVIAGENTPKTFTYEDILYKRQLAESIVQPDSRQLIFTVGACVGTVAVDKIVRTVTAHEQTIKEFAKDNGLEYGTDVLLESRDINTEKPRSAPYRYAPDLAQQVHEQKGPAINGTEDHLPRPGNFLSAFNASRAAIQRLLGVRNGETKPSPRVLFAREGLLIPRLQAEVQKTPDKKFYNPTADSLWLGNRTRGEGNPQEDELAKLENQIQIKIDQNTDADEIKRLADKFNKYRQPGKISFILRFGVDNLDKIPAVMQAIKEHAPESLIITDPMHGNTYEEEMTVQKSDDKPDRCKTRAVTDITTEMKAVITEAKKVGLRCHGAHLEAGTFEDSGHLVAMSCVDKRGDKPNTKPGLDPLLNPTQLRQVLDEFIKYSQEQTAS